MKYWLFLIGVCFTLHQVVAQGFYTKNSGEIIFSNAYISKPGQDPGSRLRFTLWFHTGLETHYDFHSHLGLFSGINVRNIGITSFEDIQSGDEPLLERFGDLDNIKIKRRVYALGVPLAFKVIFPGNHSYLFLGGECQVPFHFKHKFFVNGQKLKQSWWFNNRVNLFLPSVFVGYKMKKGWQVKLKLYLDDFLNQDYVNTSNIKPYQGMETIMYHVSFSYWIPIQEITGKNEIFAMFNQK